MVWLQDHSRSQECNPFVLWIYRKGSSWEARHRYVSLLIFSLGLVTTEWLFLGS